MCSHLVLCYKKQNDFVRCIEQVLFSMNFTDFLRQPTLFIILVSWNKRAGIGVDSWEETGGQCKVLEKCR